VGCQADGVKRAARPFLDRTRARAWAVQVHYHWETALPRGTVLDALAEVAATRHISPARLSYVVELLELLHLRLEEIDARISGNLENWKLSRISRIDRAIIRIASVEILYVDDVHAKVAIQEAVRIADSYGGGDSPGFVNGVLDGIYRRSG